VLLATKTALKEKAYLKECFGDESPRDTVG